jgi:hypothetical protein
MLQGELTRLAMSTSRAESDIHINSTKVEADWNYSPSSSLMRLIEGEHQRPLEDVTR